MSFIDAHGFPAGQYTSREFADLCANNGVTRSMGRRATCFDNAVSESYFATYKKELIHTRPWNNLMEARQHTFLGIEGYYNRRRRHSTLQYLTPHDPTASAGNRPHFQPGTERPPGRT